MNKLKRIAEIVTPLTEMVGDHPEFFGESIAEEIALLNGLREIREIATTQEDKE